MNVTIGQRIHDLLIDKDMNITELHEKTGIPRTKLSMIRNDYTDTNNGKQRTLTTDELLLCAEALGVSPAFLLTGYNEENATIASDIGLSNDTIKTLKKKDDPRIQKAIDIMVKNRDILPFLFHFFTDPDTVFESSGVYIKTESGERIPNPTYTQSDMERLCRLKLLDDLQAIREENKGGKTK